MTRKASAEDLTYYRKEQQFKVSKNDIDSIRQEFHDKFANIHVKLQERDKYIELCNEGQSAKIEQRFMEIRSKLQGKTL